MDGSIIGDAALNCAAFLGEHLGDEGVIVLVIVSAVIARPDGTLDAHAHIPDRG